MSKSDTTNQERTAETSLIGIDAEGSEHRWGHHRQQVRVQRPDETVDVYGAESPEAWCEIVDEQLGWVRCHARMSTAELIAEGVDA